MPSTLPSTFASAAASNTNDIASARAERNEGGRFAEWARRPNGATQTFRRSSTATLNNSQVRESVTLGLTATAAQTPPMSASLNATGSRNGGGNPEDVRYSRTQLLTFFRDQRDAGQLAGDLSDLYLGDYDNGSSNGVNVAQWGRRNESRSDAQGLEACWERERASEPLALLDMSNDEREFFSAVNSTIKGPGLNSAREGTTREGGFTRKPSISQGHGSSSAFGLMSPGSLTRLGNRRDTSDSYPFPRDANISSPIGAGRGSREESWTAGTPPTLQRRKTNQIDEGDDGEGLDKESRPMADATDRRSLFGSLRRTGTMPQNAGLESSSPWSQSSTAANPMGAFGALGSGISTGPTPLSAEKPRPALARVESRFRNLMSKPSAEDEGGQILERAPPGYLGALGEQHSLSPANEQRPGSTRYDKQDRQISQDTNTFAAEGETNQFGSAALGGGDEAENQYGTPPRHQQLAPQYSSFYPQELGQQNSPTFTNPYASPPQQLSNLRNVGEGADEGETTLHLPGLGDQGHENSTGFGAHLPSARPGGSDSRFFDRVQAGGAAAVPPHNRGFGGFGALGGGLPGLGTPSSWSYNPTIGTPTREKAGFEGFAERPSDFGSAHAPATLGTIGRGGSRLGSLFPTAMQEQMRGSRPGEGFGQEIEEETYRNESDSPFHTNRGKFDEFIGAPGGSHSMRDSDSATGTDLIGQPQSPAQFQLINEPSPPQGALGHTMQSHSSLRRMPSMGSASQPPAAQQKTMVMPDRIRWLYRDPQGNPQGPWSGLEMHDWYRAGFFSPELLVKKLEDPDFEPLAQLIRKIGNSREPFLVPQIGIPGPPNTQAGPSWPTQAATAPAAAPAAIGQPPFAGAFPSFGTTLTADQQNALERRKQEEQFLMARQKEHLAHQQVLAKQMHMQSAHGILPQQLHHQASGHSLHSQPSFNSLTSPTGFQTSPPTQPLGSVPLSGGFENTFRLPIGMGHGPIGSGIDSLSHSREEDVGTLDYGHNLATGQRTLQAVVGRPHQGPQDDLVADDRQVSELLAGRANLERLQAEENARLLDDKAVHHDGSRLREFNELQRVREGERQQAQLLANQRSEEPTLTEQVQKAASAKQAPEVQPVWAKTEYNVLKISPPPVSASPLPAPAARRNRQHVADALNAESVSQSQSPSLEIGGPSVAPWAKENAESKPSMSLKEIQEAEARRVAKQEEIAAAVRRTAMEKELINAVSPLAPGLPSSSTWASNDSPTTPTSLSTAWAKPVAGKVVVSSAASSKKTFSQIQMEEEALTRRKKALASASASGLAAGAGVSVAQSLAGKRYADLASKITTTNQQQPAAASGAWTTVGASGKVRVPSVTGQLPAALKNTSSAMSAQALRPKPSSTKSSLATAQLNAQEEFRKWAVSELRPDLNKGVQVDDFVQGLAVFPPDIDIITEAVHSVSQTIDSRHFAEEYVRRRALADKGKSEPVAGLLSSVSGALDNKSGAGGWSEVARKGSIHTAPKEETTAFKIVASKKKSSKR